MNNNGTSFSYWKLTRTNSCTNVRRPKLLGGRATLLLAAKEPHNITLVSCNRSQCTAVLVALRSGSAKNLFMVLVTRKYRLPYRATLTTSQLTAHHDDIDRCRRENRGEGAPPLQHRTHQVILPISCIPGLAGWLICHALCRTALRWPQHEC